MTVILFVLMALLWVELLYVLGGYIVRRVPAQKAKRITILFIASFGLSPLLYEYWLYYDFQSYCVLNAGMVKNSPVKTDSIIYEGWDRQWTLAWRARAIKHIVFTDDPAFSFQPYVTAGPKETVWTKDCVQKSAIIDGQALPPSSRWLQRYNICLTKPENNEAPKYRLRFHYNPSVYPDFRFYRYLEWVNDAKTDYGFQLIEEQTGEIKSEFKALSTPTGPIFSLFGIYYNSRYTCPVGKFDMTVYKNHTELGLEDFIEKAIVQGGE
jgi:hypothetical protein